MSRFKALRVRDSKVCDVEVGDDDGVRYAGEIGPGRHPVAQIQGKDDVVFMLYDTSAMDEATTLPPPLDDLLVEKTAVLCMVDDGCLADFDEGAWRAVVKALTKKAVRIPTPAASAAIEAFAVWKR